jgi:class 3 adenylate cyclase
VRDSLAPAPAPHEQRKTVTIVFCDVMGSTALGERLDPEALRRVMSRYFDAMKVSIERHGGAVEKFIGDAVMAVFGIPLVHEDDALRAVRAAADMRMALELPNRELEREGRCPLRDLALGHRCRRLQTASSRCEDRYGHGRLAIARSDALRRSDDGSRVT